MNPQIMVLMQFEFPGNEFRSYLQTYAEDAMQLYNSLPYFYSVTFSRKSGSITAPVGGLLIKSNIAKDDDKFRDLLFEATDQLKPSASTRAKANSMQVTKTHVPGTSMPTEADLERIALETYTLIARGGNA